MRRLALLPLIGLLGAASDDIPRGPGTLIYGGWPPDRYLREARPNLILTTYDRVQALCRLGTPTPLPPGVPYDGCHRGKWIITFLPSKGDGEHFARVFAHELAHHHGWAKDHPL